MTTPIHAGSEMTEENAQTTAQKLAQSQAEMDLRDYVRNLRLNGGVIASSLAADMIENALRLHT